MSGPLGSAVEAAWAYERLHVGALFRQWTEPVLDAAHVTTGNRVLDVACGTGVLARAGCARVGPDGSVVGLDVGPGMLTVAESIEPAVSWVAGDAGALPFEDAHFDAVVSQFGLMFFSDRVGAIREMLRCLRPGGRTAVAVWDALERSQAYLSRSTCWSGARVLLRLQPCVPRSHWAIPMSSGSCSRRPGQPRSRSIPSTARPSSRACARWSRRTCAAGCL